MPKTARIFVFGLVFLFLFLSSSVTFANNLSISNVTLTDRSPSTNTVTIQFDVAWENAWRSKINHDAIWLTFRLYDPSVSPINKKLCQVSASGLNPTGSSSGSNTGLELLVPEDKEGSFFRLKSFQTVDSVTSSAVRIPIDYSTCGFTTENNVNVSVLGIEMVNIPTGSFYAGDGGSTATFVQGSSDSDPWNIAGESSISVTDSASDGYRYVSGGHPDEDPTGAQFSISGDFPKGYRSFYVMKYEITEGMWVEFINSLFSDQARVHHDLTDTTHKNSDSVLSRNTISCSGSPLVCVSERPSRALSYLTWSDLSAFLDWAALRPMTELEYEKASRGPLRSVVSEFAWGTTDIIPASILSGSNEDGTETVTDVSANAACNNSTLSGGDAANGAGYTEGPLRAGIFATTSSERITAGASYYGVMELSGNVRERLVSVGNASGRLFTGTPGDGVLSTESGFEGYATNTDWPGIDVVPSRGVTGAEGSGLRGGGYSDNSSYLRISDRTDAAIGTNNASNATGGRGARTSPEDQ